MPTYQTRNPKAAHSPLRSTPLFRPAGRLIAQTPREDTDRALWIANRDLPRAESFVRVACSALSRANRIKGPMRRVWQGKAMRQINLARAGLRRARKALDAATIAMLALDANLLGAA